MSDTIQTLHDKLQKLGGEINRRKFAMESSVLLKQEFYRLSKKYQTMKYRKGGDIMADTTAKTEKKAEPKDVLIRNLKKSALTILLILRHTPEKYSNDQKEALLKDLRKYI